jgi:hypothetical protein
MPLGAAGQWMVDAGVRLLSRADQLVWQRWVDGDGWFPGKSEPDPLPPAVAVVATNAVQALVASMDLDIRQGGLSEDDALDCLNDIDRAKAVIAGLRDDIEQQERISAYETH